MKDYIFDFILLGILYCILSLTKWRKQSKMNLLLFSLMYLYISLVLYVTVMPFGFPMGGVNDLYYKTINLIPFRDIRMHYGNAVREAVLNVIMMMPFGFLLPVVLQKKFIYTIFASFLFSLLIESYQLLNVWWCGISTRSFDVTDLITNTIGGFTGYILYLIFKPVINVILSKLRQNLQTVR